MITSDKQELFRIFEEHWNTTWIGDGSGAFWRRNGPMHMVASLEAARQIVREHFEGARKQPNPSSEPTHSEPSSS